MAKFATPVAMKVTEKQGIELIKSLEALGYRHIHKRYVGYVTTSWNGEHNLATVMDFKPKQRYIIEEYNPELFLAISAMTEGEEWIVGEYLTYRYESKPYKVKSFGGVSLEVSGLAQQGSELYKKATLEELTNHFTKPKETFELPKKWKLEVTEENFNAVNKWKKSIGKYTMLVPGHAVDQEGYWSRTIDNISAIKTVITTEQFMEHVYKPTFNKIPEEFYVKYCEGFTEDIFDQLYAWGEKNSEGPIRGHDDKYQSFVTGIGPYNGPLDRFNFQKKVDEGNFNSQHVYGCDNHDWNGRVKTEYTLEQVKELINYKPKTNKNECKEDSYERESREIKQIDEDLDSISSREGGKEIKIRTVSSRNLCERGSIESSNSITSSRGSSSRLRAERGRLYI